MLEKTCATILLAASMMPLLVGCDRGGSDSKDTGAATLQTAQVRAARIVMPPPGAHMAAG